MSIEEDGGFIGFVPGRLEIKERPELSVFPYNVLFASHKITNRKRALYLPDIESFKQDPDKLSMRYHNDCGGKSWLLIEYNPLKRSYLGQKFVNNKSVMEASGNEWSMFFVHFTMLGLTDGEETGEFEYKL